MYSCLSFFCRIAAVLDLDSSLLILDGIGSVTSVKLESFFFSPLLLFPSELELLSDEDEDEELDLFRCG